MKKRPYQKVGKMALLLALGVAMTLPSSVYAMDSGSDTSETPQTSVSTPTPEDTTKVETPETKEETKPEEKVQVPEATPEVKQAPTQENNIETYAYDVNKPIIDKVEFPDNGKTVNPGDKLPIYVTAHDDDGAIKEVYVRVEYDSDADDNETDSIMLTYNQANNRYEGTTTVLGGGYKKGYLNYLRVTDDSSNYVENYLYNDNQSPLYQFTIANSEKQTLTIDNITLTNNHGKLERGTPYDIKVDIPADKKSDIAELNLIFENEDGHTIWKTFNLYDNVNLEAEPLTVDDYDEPGKYVLSRIEANGKTNLYNVTYANSSDIWFTVEGKAIENTQVPPTVTSLSIDKNKEVVGPGDVLHFTMTAKSNNGKLDKDAYIYLRATADVLNNSVSVDMTYDEVKQAYVGTYTIPENMYPCEWYIEQVNVYDEVGNTQHWFDNLDPGNKYPYYVKVKNDDTYVNPTYKANITFEKLDASGEYVVAGTWSKDKIARRTTFAEAGFTLPDGSTSFKGLKFVGWADYNGNLIKSTDEIVDDMENEVYYAVYDKKVVDICYSYPDVNLNSITKVETVAVEKNTTYAQLLSVYKKNFSDMYQGVAFDGWKYPDHAFNRDETIDSIIPNGPRYGVTLQATYKNKIVVETSVYYTGTKGFSEIINTIKLVDKGTTYESIRKEMSQKAAPTSYPGLRFKRWALGNDDEQKGEININYDNIYVYAEYENYLVTFMIDPVFKPQEGTQTYAAGGIGGYDPEKMECVKMLLAEDGETIKVPDFPEYESITWGYSKPEGENLTIHSDRTFYGYGVKKGTTPDTKPEPQPKPNNDKTLKEEVISNIVTEIKSAGKGERIDISMGDVTIVPVDVLKAAKGKDVTVHLQMNGYSWTIKGKDITGTNLSDINLEITMDHSAIPNKVIKELAGDQPVRELSLAHNGNFGFRAELSVNVGKEYNGKYGNLYYYDSEGKLVFMNAGKIDANGNVSLAFSHASDYIIVISDKAVKKPSANTDKPKKENKTENEPVTPNTGDTTNQAMYLFFLISAGACMSILLKKRSCKEN